MREWELSRKDLPCLILAADARFGRTHYPDDQIWELELSSGEPAALTLQTTYGLRARQMRMYPRFVEGDKAVSNPDEFIEPPIIRKFYANYTLITCTPFDGLDAVLEYWVRGSDQLGGRIRLINSSVTPRTVRMEWVAVFVPASEEDDQLGPSVVEGVQTLTSRAANIRPVIFLSGGAEAHSSPSTSLSLPLDLKPGVHRTLYWGHAAAQDETESFQKARQFATLNWEEEVARMDMTNASQLEVQTGDPNWDLTFALGQTCAQRLFVDPGNHLPHKSFVQTRLPDQGYSRRGDGRDYDHLWAGQNVLETRHLFSQILPAQPDTAIGLLENFLSTQQKDGSVDWRPGLSGKPSGLLATPMLCDLAWRIYRLTGDRVWLVQVFPRLQKFLQSWFHEDHDRDQDGIPEWDNPLQTGYDENPLFADWQEWAQGVGVQNFERPSLTAMLYSECSRLIQIAAEIQYHASVPALEEKQNRLKVSLQKAWDEEDGTYRYRDRESHLSPPGLTLTRQKGPGLILMTERPFNPQARLSIRIHRTVEGDREPRIEIQGVSAQGTAQEEVIESDQVTWSLGWGTGVSTNLFQRVTRIKIEGIQQEDEVIVRTVDYRHLDQTLLTPLWAGIPDPDQADRFTRKIILNPNLFWRPCGISACAGTAPEEAAEMCETIWMPWNELVGEGLVRYGYREAAADLINRVMRALTLNVKTNGAFRKTYHAATGEGIGERNSVLGLPPLKLFLEVLGVQIDSIWRVHLSGRNPFPWPVTVRFRGLEVIRKLDTTRVCFPNGETVEVDSPEPCVVEGR